MHRLIRGSGRAALFATAALTVLAAAQVAQAADVRGRVVDASGVRFLQGALVEIVELGRTAEVGADGAYRFSGVPTGSYTLRVTYAGASSFEARINVANEADIVSNEVILSPDSTTVDAVLAVGQRASQASAIQRQRAADGVESVLTRDAVGQFPDQNVAESIRRLPGINVLNDQGEGRFVSVRGMDPDLNSASINGVRTPAPESDIRAVALDVIPSELIESIEIKKTLTPDMDADTIGGSIEINTTSAFERSGSFFGGKVEGSYNDLNGEWSPKGSFDFSTLLTERVGIAGGLSYYNRTFSTDNIEADDWAVSGGIIYPEVLEFRDYDVERTRLSGALSLDFDVSDSTQLYIRGLHSIFEDQEFRGRLTIEATDPIAGGPSRATFDSDEEEIRVERDLKDRYEEQIISSLTFGGETETGPWRLTYSASFAKASEEEAGSLDPVNFRRDFEDDGLVLELDYGNWRNPTYNVLGGSALFLDPDEYELNDIERTARSLAEDRETAFQFDLSRDFPLAQGMFRLQGGLKSRSREKTYDQNIEIYEYDGPGDFTLGDVLGRSTYGLADIDPVADWFAPRRFFNENFADFELEELDSEFESVVADYGFNEDINAVYLMGRYQSGPLRLIGGVRVEQTKQDVRGNFVQFIEEDADLPGGGTAPDDINIITPVAFSREYTDTLPSIALRYEVSPNVVLRAGAYRSVVRPKPGQIAPRFVTETDDNNETAGEFGNPDLLPFEAWNYDVSAEWYFASNSVVSAGLFHKDIENYIAVREFANGVFNGIAYDEAEIPINIGEASVSGFEFNYQTVLDQLPAPFDGVLLGFNYTHTNSEGVITDGLNGTRLIPLPAAAPNTFNAMIGYEKGPWSLRLSAAYRDGYLDEVAGNAQTDRYVEPHTQLDFVGRYRINDDVQVFGEVINITDEPYVAYQQGAGGPRLLQYEEYSWTAKFGVKITR